LDSSDFV